MIDKIEVNRVDTYEEAIVEMKRLGENVEEVKKLSKKRAKFVIGGLLALDVGIAAIASMMGMDVGSILHTIGFTIPISAPIIGYGVAKIQADNRSIKKARAYQDGSRFEGMTEEEVIKFANDTSAEMDAINSKRR